MFENDEFLAFFEKSDASPEKVKHAVQRALDAHNAEGTPNFAKSIERNWSTVLVAMNFLVGRCTASAMASASRKSFFCPFE